MNRNLYMFALLLLIMTLISSFGGAIRFEENFYNEVFDLLDDEKVEVIEGNDEKDIASSSMEIEGTEENVPSEAPVEPSPEPVLPSPIEVEEEEVVSPTPKDIEAYESEQYATF